MIGGASPAPTAEEDACRAAWLDGHAAAMAVRDDALAEAVAACQAAVRGINDTANQLRGQVAATVQALAVAIARHLLEREVTADPTLMQKLVTRALAIAPMNGAVTVRMHPADLVALRALGALPDAPAAGIELRWAGDEAISRGSCVIESPTAIVDGRIDRALLDIYEQISHD